MRTFRRFSSVTCVLLVTAMLLGSVLWVPVSAANLVWESGSTLYTCEILGCSPTVTYGVGGLILVNNTATPAAGQTLAEWISLDDFQAGCPTHYWMQTGYAIGALPDGTFVNQPVFYTESNLPRTDNTCCNYTFRNKGLASFGTWHSFNAWTDGLTPSTTFASIDGVQQEVVHEQYFLKGQATGSLEAHMPDPPQRDGNGHWTSLQFYGPNCYVGCSGLSWKAWGSSDGNSIAGTATSAHPFINCHGYLLQQISTVEFIVAGAAPPCASGGGGGGLGGGKNPFYEVPPATASPRLIGPGPDGGAPQGPFVVNPITYWVAGIIIAVAALYGAYRVRKQRLARRKSQ